MTFTASRDPKKNLYWSKDSLRGEESVVEFRFAPASLIASPVEWRQRMDARNNDFPLQSEYVYTSGGGPAAPSASPGISISHILVTLRREWRFPVLGCLIGLTLGLSYVLFVPTLYKSSARIMLDRSVTRYLQTNKIVDDPTFDEAEIASQVYILSSETIAVPVIRSMNLSHDSEFVGPPNAIGAQILGRINKLLKPVKRLIGLNDHADATIDPDAVLEQTAV